MRKYNLLSRMLIHFTLLKSHFMFESKYYYIFQKKSKLYLTCPLAQLVGAGKRFREFERPKKQVCDIMSRWRPRTFCSDQGNFCPLPHCLMGHLTDLVTPFSN